MEASHNAIEFLRLCADNIRGLEIHIMEVSSKPSILFIKDLFDELLNGKNKETSNILLEYLHMDCPTLSFEDISDVLGGFIGEFCL